MTPAARASLVVTIPLLMMTGLFTDELFAPAPSYRTPIATVAPRSTSTTTKPHQFADRSETITQPDTDAEQALDLYGNEVTVAVAEYKLDAAGRLYEAHSPQSELLRLGSPKS